MVEFSLQSGFPVTIETGGAGAAQCLHRTRRSNAKDQTVAFVRKIQCAIAQIDAQTGYSAQ
jgi:hypothetical protein